MPTGLTMLAGTGPREMTGVDAWAVVADAPATAPTTGLGTPAADAPPAAATPPAATAPPGINGRDGAAPFATANLSFSIAILLIFSLKCCTTNACKICSA